MVGSKQIQILLVESDEAESQWLSSAFEETGLMSVVEVASDGAAALACLRGESPYSTPAEPSLILIDVHGTAGLQPALARDLELLAELKSDATLRSIPVVVVTDSTAESDILNAYSHGACSFVSKPASVDERRCLFSRFAGYWAQVAQLPRAVNESEDVFGRSLDDAASSGDPQIAPIEILIVDDSEDDVVLLQEAFSGCPLVDFIERVEDGEEAMRFLRREGPYSNARRPALILLDINMPRKNGFEVLAEMRADETLCRIPVVMLTTSKQETDILRAYENGACSFISKPVNFDRMREIAHQFATYWALVADIPDNHESIPA